MLESFPETPTVALHVLLADDNLLNQRITQLILTKQGHRVDVVGNGYDAVMAVQRKTYSLILMDSDMPVMDGLEATRRIVSYYRDRHRPYMVAFTAGAERAACTAAGMDGYLQKSVGLPQLEKLLQTATDTATTRPRKSEEHR